MLISKCSKNLYTPLLSYLNVNNYYARPLAEIIAVKIMMLYENIAAAITKVGEEKVELRMLIKTTYTL